MRILGKLLTIGSFSCVTFLHVHAAWIAVGENPGRFEKLAAEELQRFLSQISETDHAIVAEKSITASGGIYLGDTAFARENGVDCAALAPEEWLLKSVGEDLIIAGGRPVGALYGAYELLEKLGVCFLTMDATYVPQISPLTLPELDERATPSFAGRNIYDGYPVNFKRGECDASYAPYHLFRLRSRINGSQGHTFAKGLYNGDLFRLSTQVRSYHNFYQYVDPEQYFDSNPEFFSMNAQGKRFLGNPHGGNLCLSNPEVVRITLETLRKNIKADRERLPKEEWPVLYDISQNDQAKFMCLCPRCSEISAEEGECGLLLHYINQVATAIAQDYPEIMIRTFAYSSTDKPPKTIRPAANVIVQYCDLYTRSDCFRPLRSKFNTDQRELLENWAELNPRLALWDYWNMGGTSYFDPPRPEVLVDTLKPDFQFFKDCGVEALFLQASKDFVAPQNFFDLHCFVASRLMVDLTQDAESLINIFLNYYYGDAAPMMREYLDALRQGVAAQENRQLVLFMQRWHYITPQNLLAFYRLFEKAEAAVPVDSPEAQRVGEEKIALLWQIVFFRDANKSVFAEAGFSLSSIQQELELRVAEFIGKCRPGNPDYLQDKFQERAAVLLANLPTPKKFKNVPETSLRIFGYPHHKGGRHSTVRDDPASPTGKTMVTNTTSAEAHGTTRKGSHRTHPNTFGVWAPGVGNKSMRVMPIPTDGRYHWYRIPMVDLGAKTIFWAHHWWIQIDLSRAFVNDDGEDYVNRYDLYFSAKFTGPAYIPDSSAVNEIAVDMVVLVKPGSMPESGPASGLYQDRVPRLRNVQLVKDGFEGSRRYWRTSPNTNGSVQLVHDKTRAARQNSCLLLKADNTHDAEEFSGLCLRNTLLPDSWGRKLRLAMDAKGSGSFRLGVRTFRKLENGTNAKRMVWGTPIDLNETYRRIKLDFQMLEPNPTHISMIAEVRGENAEALLDEVLLTDTSCTQTKLIVEPAYQMLRPDADIRPIFFNLTTNGTSRQGIPVQINVAGKDAVTEQKTNVQGDVMVESLPGEHDAAALVQLNAMAPEFGAAAKAYVQYTERAEIEQYEQLAQQIKPNRPMNILVLGDSLTDLDRGHNHVDIMQYFLDKTHPGMFTFYNYAVRGDDIDRVCRRLTETLGGKFKDRYLGIFSRTYDLVLVLLGHNDTKASSSTDFQEALIPPARQYELYNQLIARLKKEQVGKIVLISPTCSNFELCKANSAALQRVHNRFGDPRHLRAFDDVLKQLAQEHQLGHLDVYTPTQNHPDKPSLFHPKDGVHLTQAGHEVLAMEILRRLGPFVD